MPAKAQAAAPPKWQRAPDSLVAAFDKAMLPFPQAERRKMFGYPSAFANGNMFAGLFQDSMVLRLPDEDRAKFLKLKGAHPFEPMAGRPMREYVVVPDGVMKSSRQLNAWLGKSFEYARSLPPKVKKAKKK